jgi:hypothetical protein
MSLQLTRDDADAVDLLLEHSISCRQANRRLARSPAPPGQRIAQVAAVLDLLNWHLADEAPADLPARTLRRIDAVVRRDRRPGEAQIGAWPT